GDNHRGDVGPHQADERPGVVGDLDSQAVGGKELLGGEAFDLLVSDVELPRKQRLSIRAEDVKRGAAFVKIDADESRLVAGASGAGHGRPPLAFGFGFTFERVHGDKLHEGLSQGWPPCAPSTTGRPVGRIDNYLFELEAQPDWS